MKIFLSALVFLLFNAAAFAKAPPCHSDGAVYRPQGISEEGDYEITIENLHPKHPGEATATLHLNLYEKGNRKLLTTAALTYGCSGGGLGECQVVMKNISPIDVMTMNKNFTQDRRDLLSHAPDILLLPHITYRFYHRIHSENANPDVKYLSQPAAQMALPPEIWYRRSCGKPSLSFGKIR